MNLRKVILECKNYVDTDDIIHMVFAIKSNDSFEPLSEATVLKLTLEEMEMNLIDIENSKCPGYKYFLEINIIQDFIEDIWNMDEYKSDDEKVKRVIYYAEFDA
ncbi:MAG: hypothetical protein WBP41_14145 [Saprospiraceae bacterium]